MNLKNLSYIQIALGISVAVHGVLLTVRFVDPEGFNRVFQDTPLEVILVNAKSNEKPDKAQALAQANLAGGGDAEEGRASSPLPPTALNTNGQAIEDQTMQTLQALLEQQNLLLAQSKSQFLRSPSDPQNRSDNTSLRQSEQERQRAQLIAEIEKRINTENSRPKKRYISPATREAAYALYYDALRQAIENKGTENFPTSGGKKLYGELTMIITVNHDGRVIETEVVQGSGNATLDRRAASIVRAAAPFGNFNPAMRHLADQIVVVSRFNFTRDEILHTRVEAQQ